jgi:hypothetical protein
VISTVAVAVCGLAVEEWIATRVLKNTLALASQYRDQLTTAITQLQQQDAELSKSRTVQEHELKSVQSSFSRPAKEPGQPAASGRARTALMTDPKFQNLLLTARRASLATIYGPFFTKLRLSTEQIDRFKEAVLNYEENKMDSAAIRDAQTLASGNSAITDFDTKNSTELKEVLGTLLGEDGYRQLKDYERSLPARKAVDDFAGAAAIAGVPLAPDQAEQLTQLVAQTSPEFRNGGSVKSVDWNQVLGGAITLLSDAQAEIIKRTTLPAQYLQKIQAIAEQPPQPGTNILISSELP